MTPYTDEHGLAVAPYLGDTHYHSLEFSSRFIRRAIEAAIKASDGRPPENPHDPRLANLDEIPFAATLRVPLEPGGMSELTMKRTPTEVAPSLKVWWVMVGKRFPGLWLRSLLIPLIAMRIQKKGNISVTGAFWQALKMPFTLPLFFFTTLGFALRGEVNYMPDPEALYVAIKGAVAAQFIINAQMLKEMGWRFGEMQKISGEFLDQVGIQKGDVAINLVGIGTFNVGGDEQPVDAKAA